MNLQVCQSCAMPLSDESFYGTNADGTKTKEYCHYCYEEGKFKQDMTMEEMIEVCVPHMKAQGMEEEVARKLMQDALPNLTRWSK